MSASSAATLLDRLRAGPRPARNAHLLSPEALAVAANPAATAISPIVLAGFVRMAEFALIALVGIAVFAAYVAPGEGAIVKPSVDNLLTLGFAIAAGNESL